MAALRWIGEPISEGGVTERRFNLERESGIVPGIMWTPAQQDRPVPLVMMGHGGSGHKRADRQLLLVCGPAEARRGEVADARRAVGDPVAVGARDPGPRAVRPRIRSRRAGSAGRMFRAG